MGVVNVGLTCVMVGERRCDGGKGDARCDEEVLDLHFCDISVFDIPQGETCW
jgi:hypothetical protein